MNLQTLIQDAGYEVRSYSGRGMSGKECLGVDLDPNQTIMEFFADLLDACPQDEGFALDIISDALRIAKTDSMGLGSIVYWPGVPFAHLCAACGEEFDPGDSGAVICGTCDGCDE